MVAKLMVMPVSLFLFQQARLWQSATVSPATDLNRADPVLRVFASRTGAAASHADAAGRTAAVEPLVRPPLAGTNTLGLAG